MGIMFKATAMAAALLSAAASSAFAATDEEIAQKCVVGWSWHASTGFQFTYLAGGDVQFYGRQTVAGYSPLLTGHGTYEVKNGVLSQHTSVDGAAAAREISLPIEMLPSGACFITIAGHKRPMWINGKPFNP
ncbi:MAG TPA: hypothetical protein VG328_00365 [Stellaceae bacterium]|nr:hypothetical protein [Stellaceae bacterium]